MSKRRNKGRLPPFIPLIKSTWNHPAMKALSHGAFRLHVALRGHYNSDLGNAVYLSTRDAMKELGANTDSIQRWFRELQHYGFIVMTEPGCLGVDGTGKAPHYRLTESQYQGQMPTRDFDRWNGVKFKDTGQTAARARLRARQSRHRKNRIPYPKLRTVCTRNCVHFRARRHLKSTKVYPKLRTYRRESLYPKLRT
jgi:hypothetical protein